MQALQALLGGRFARSSVELLASFRPRRAFPAVMVLSIATGALVGLLVAGFEQLTVEVLLERLLEEARLQRGSGSDNV